MLGASRVRAFREVTLPLLWAPIAAAASIVFLFTFTAFGVVLLIADPAHATLEVEIYRQAVELLDFPIAAALALVQMLAVIALLLVLARMQERRAITQRLVAARDAARRPRGWERVVVSGVLGVTIVFLGGPLLVLAVESVRLGGSWSLAVLSGVELQRRDRHAVRSRVAGVAQLTRVRGARRGDRGGGRWARVGGDRVAARAGDAGDGHPADASVGNLGGHDRVRVPRCT